jgi:hypothetical protein
MVTFTIEIEGGIFPSPPNISFAGGWFTGLLRASECDVENEDMNEMTLPEVLTLAWPPYPAI